MGVCKSLKEEVGVVVCEMWGLAELSVGLVHEEGLESLLRSNSNCWSADPVSGCDSFWVNWC